MALMFEPIKQAMHKDLLNPWRKPTRDDDWLINKMLTTVHDQFKDALIKHRSVSKDRAQILADGRIYAGQDALAEQLVDELGGLHEAVKYAGKLVKLDDLKSYIRIVESKTGYSRLCHGPIQVNHDPGHWGGVSIQ